MNNCRNTQNNAKKYAKMGQKCCDKNVMLMFEHELYSWSENKIFSFIL